jgi:hypothetical protein
MVKSKGRKKKFMPYYQSATGKEIIIKLGKNKKELKIPISPEFFTQDNLDLIFPKHIKRIDSVDDIVRREMMRQIPQFFPERFLQEFIPTGSWKGQRCFIIGGGPSLTGFNFSQLRYEKVIAINKSFVAAPFAEIAFAIDRQFQDWVTNPDKGGGVMEEAQKKWGNFEGHKVWLKIPGEIYQSDIEFVRLAGHEGISQSLEEGVFDGSNSGYAAINLAITLGANPIYLLGYDMKHDKEGNSHFHGGYPKPQVEKQLEMFARKFPALAKQAKEKGIQIINLNKDSALECFEFGDLPKLNKNEYTKKWIVISFYTKGTSYEQEIEKLRESLEEFKVDYHFFPFVPQGTWRKNLNYKSECILKAFDMFPNQDIVFIDADGIMRQYPILFNVLSRQKYFDVAASFRKYSPRSGDANELLSGTLWFPNNERGRNLVRKWHEVGLQREDIRHQQCLRMAIEQLQDSGTEVRVCRMPFEYTYVFDYSYPTKKKPIIEHFQASRRFRKEVGFGTTLKWETK